MLNSNVHINTLPDKKFIFIIAKCCVKSHLRMSVKHTVRTVYCNTLEGFFLSSSMIIRCTYTASLVLVTSSCAQCVNDSVRA